MSTKPEQVLIDREHVAQVAQAGLSNGKRRAFKIPLVALGFLAGFELLIAICFSFTSMSPDDVHDLAWTGVAMFFGIGFWLVLGLRILLMRDVHQTERLIKDGVPHRGVITSRRFVAESPIGGASNMTVAWGEGGGEVSARMNDRVDAFEGPIEREVVVLTRGRARWVGVVVGNKFLLALRPPREYHLFGKKNA